MVVPRPRVAPTASRAGKSTSTRMRVSAMEAVSADADCGDTAARKLKWRMAKVRDLPGGLEPRLACLTSVADRSSRVE